MTTLPSSCRARHRPWPGRTAPTAALLLLATVGCDLITPDAPPEETVLAGTIEGLTPSQIGQLAGDAEFARRFAPAEGLGPIFVATSCEQCHVGDGKGHPAFNLTRFGRDLPSGFDPLTSRGGPQLQHRAVAGYPPEVIPGEASGVSVFTAPAVTGLGFLDAVPDALALIVRARRELCRRQFFGRIHKTQAAQKAPLGVTRGPRRPPLRY